MVVEADGDAALERLYARRSGLPRQSLPPYHGTATSWQNHEFDGDTAFVVELPGGRLDAAGARRHARAVLALARAIARRASDAQADPVRAGAARADGGLRAAPLRDRRLPPGDPQVIVQHFTVTDTFQPVFDYFSVNAPDPELGELPGVCAHYVIDRDGTIYELVPPRIMCRHTVGLNYTAIGIEHVGRSDAQVMGNGAPARRVAAPHANAPGPPRDRHPQRDRPQREPLEPVPPRAGRAAAHPDPRGLPEADDGRLSPRARAAAGAGEPALDAPAPQPREAIARERHRNVRNHAPEVPERAGHEPRLGAFDGIASESSDLSHPAARYQRYRQRSMATAVKTKTTELGDSRVRVEVEVESGTLEREMETAAAAIGREMRVPGFRKGKVPRRW